MTDSSALLTPPQVTAGLRETRDLIRAQQRAGKRVGFVPTMGALHDGHLSLVDRSRQECDYTVVSIFVNPKQFAPQEDFSKYPRTWERDLELLAARKIDLVFAPSVEEMYPTSFSTQVEVVGIADRWEGACRPGHFRGVTTVVLKLLQVVPADRAYFGRKDYQQLLTVRRMATDLSLPVKIVGCPLVRDSDGLALSSRNIYLSADERQHALVLSRSLREAQQMFAAGERNAAKIRDSLRQAIAGEPGVQLEYAAVVDPASLEELSHIDTGAVVLLAARVGQTRLIDNELLGSAEI